MSKKGNKPIFQSYLLPSMLVDQIQTKVIENKEYPRSDSKKNLIKCIALIYHHQVNNYTMEYVALGAAYWKKVFGGNYYQKVIKPLLDQKLIEVYDFRYRNKGKESDKGQVGKRYRIHPDLVNNEFKKLNYQHDRIQDQTIYLDNANDNKLTAYIMDDVRIDIMGERAKTWVDEQLETTVRNEYLKTDYPDYFPDKFIISFNEQIIENGRISFIKRYSTIKAATIRAKLEGKQLLFFKDSFYVVDVDVFLQNRLQMIRHHYFREISKINSLHLDINKKQNKKTLRVYNDLSNFPSHLLKFIRINHKTVHNIDLKSSQLLLLANLINLFLLKFSVLKQTDTTS